MYQFIQQQSCIVGLDGAAVELTVPVVSVAVIVVCSILSVKILICYVDLDLLCHRES